LQTFLSQIYNINISILERIEEMAMKNNEVQTGALYAGFAYFLWGILPVYWKFLDHVQADEILANRIFWSFFFMLMILLQQ
jgi:chloramphenicol-sensitive protein RarD